jgi:two-component system, NtrC family, sensor kinase
LTDTPKTVTQLNQRYIQDRSLPTQKLTAWQSHLIRQSGAFDTLSYVYFGNKDGEYAEIKTYKEREIKMGKASGPSGTLQVRLFPVQNNGQVGPLKETRNYDPRSRPWFKAAAESGKSTWTPIYSFMERKNTLGLSFVRPVFSNSGSITGVLGADFALLQTQDFLRSLKLLQSGKIFILEKDGNLVATSTDKEPFREDLSRISGTEFADPLVKAVSQDLKQQLGGQFITDRPRQFIFNHNQIQQYVRVDPFNDKQGLDWLVVVVVPESDFMNEVETNRRNILLACGVATLGTILLSFLMSRWLSRSLTVLSKASQTIGSGNLSDPVPAFDSSWEVMTLAQSLEEMRQDLKTGRDRLQNYTHDLEREVALRTQDLQTRNRELTRTLQDLQTSQDHLIRAEKLAALGQLVASIAHEMNTPLGVIRSSVRNISSFLRQDLTSFIQIFNRLEQHDRQTFLHLFQQTITTLSAIAPLSSQEKRQFRQNLTQSLRDLNIENPDYIADVLVEIGIYANLHAFQDLLQTENGTEIFSTLYHVSTSQRSLQAIESATESAARVIQALRTYSSPELYKTFGEIDLIASLETALTLYQALLKRGVTVLRDYDASDSGKNPIVIWACGEELNQIWTHLIHNALQAMDYKGHLTIALSLDMSPEADDSPQNAIVHITNDGPKIPPEIQAHIYEAFFTTRPPGEGKGMGLTIVRQILEKHYGTISLSSDDSATTFTVKIPVDFRQHPITV